MMSPSPRYLKSAKPPFFLQSMSWVICSDELFWSSKLKVVDSVHPAMLFALKFFCVCWVVRANPGEGSCGVLFCKI